MADILSKVESTVRRHGMFQNRGCAVLGVSGGPDSQALLHLVRELVQKRYPALKLHAAHLHHGIRGASADEDAAFVQREAARLGLPCTVERVDVPALARKRGVGVEVAGRDVRYQFLETVARTAGANRILLGHQADDQVETVLMRAIRGAGPRGMGAIPYVRPIEGAEGVLIVRPLLDCARTELENFLRSRALQSRLDSTNLSPDYLRNRIRAAIVPRLRKEWDGSLRSDLCSLAAAAQRLQAQAEKLCAALAAERPAEYLAEYVEVDADWLRRQPSAIRPELLRRWLKAARIPHRALSSKHYERIDALLQAPKGTLSLPGEVLACRWRGIFMLCSRLLAGANEFQCELKVPGVTVIPLLGGSIETVLMDAGEDIVPQQGVAHDPLVEFVDFEKLRMPLSVRLYRAGDRMRPLGGPGRKKLQDIFTDLQVPRWKRRRIPLVVMAGKPIWIVGHRLSDDVKLTGNTEKVLRLTWEFQKR